MSEEFQEIAESEWSHFFKVEELEKKPSVITISPNEDERKRLSQRLGLNELNDLQAEIKITQETGSMIVHIEGHIRADLVQNCVTTLEPINAVVEDEFEAWYADSADIVSLAKAKHERASKSGQGEIRMLEEKDDPEEIIGGKIDLGELVTQYLSLAIDPYPHAEGVELEDNVGQLKPEEDVTNPFAALKDWKSGLDKKDQ